MKPSEIKAGATYWGRRNPLYGRYPERAVLFMGYPDCCHIGCDLVHYEDTRTKLRHAISRKAFAAWAVREVPAGREGGEGRT